MIDLRQILKEEYEKTIQSIIDPNGIATTY